MTDMSPKPKSDEAENESVPSEEDPQNDTEADPKASTKPTAKRRTKTGCLTCRKRRIKCSEEKPFCKNCIKSKRECAGYVQPLVYKQQQGLTGPDSTPRSSTTEIDFQFNHGFAPVARSAHPDLGLFNPFGPYYDQYGQPVRDRHSTSTASTHQYPDPTDVVTQDPAGYPLDTFRRHSFHNPNTQPLGYQAPQFQSYSHEQANEWFQRLQHPAHGQYTYHHGYNDPSSTMSTPNGFLESYADSSASHPAPAYVPYPRRYSMHGFVQPDHRVSRIPHLIIPDLKMDEMGNEDDPFDVDMDDCTIESEEPIFDQVEHQQRVQRSAKSGPQISGALNDRRSGPLRSTKQSSPLSPLFDERNERVFRHFVEVLGSCLSTFERPSPDPWISPRQNLWCFTLASAAFSNPALAHAILAVSGLHISKLQQTSESMSLKHFTYAARRVGKLMNLAGKRHESTTLATVLLLGYYEILNADHSRWNLHLAGATKLVAENDLTKLARRVRRTRARAVDFAMTSSNSTGAPLSVQDCAQYGIAPSLLDDTEWNIDQPLIRSLSGLDVDYDSPDTLVPDSRMMTEAEIATYRTKVDLWWWFCKQDLFQSMVSGERLLMPLEQRSMCPPRGQINVADKPYASFDHLVLVFSRLSDFGGKDRHRKQRAIFAQGGQWKPPAWLSVGGPPTPTTGAPSHTSVGTRPADRAPKPNQPEVLIESELREHHRTPSANEGRVRQNKTGGIPQIPSDGPQMFGMMPPPSKPPKMHSAFLLMEKSINQGAPYNKPAPVMDGAKKASLEEETEAALAEHKRIMEAFDLFYDSFGPEFHSIPNEGEHTSSPFGPPLRYQSPEIACMWAHYYVGRVLLHRLHPDMPPAAMVAAGVTARLTRNYTQIVGQICAGLFASIPVGPPGQAPLSPHFAAALMEISFPLLFCGVQYVDISQRGWTISKLHDIAQMTGWQTSAAVAAACEIAWEKLAQAGRGPPYARSLDRNNKDVRVNGSLRHHTPQLSASLSDAESEHESQFVSHDRALISKHGPSRVHWAMGLLSVEEDVRQMNIGTE